MNYLIPFLSASAVTLISCLLVTKLFPVMGLMDKPHNYGLKRAPIPYSVGSVLYLIFLLLTYSFLDLSAYPQVMWVLGGGLMIVVVSFIDDFKPLPPLLRLIIQVLAGILIVYGGIGIHSISNPFGEPFSLDTYISFLNGFEVVWLSDIFTVLWIVILMNSVNWLDGVNGLASGVSMIASIALFLLSIQPGHVIDQEPVIIMSSILAGIFTVFVCFDFYPARMLMGDSGSMFLGFILAVLSILAGGKVATAFLILGFPLLDAFFVVVRRIAAGRAPWKGKDRLHLHDKLIDSGMSMRGVLLLIYSLCAVFGFSALFLGPLGKFVALSIMLCLMVVLLSVILSDKKKR